ncbi:MAG TPA: 2-phospho-L-lactate guanylyltransferase [Nitrososphaera sp.]|nr:2-phospho-L-lactate guanylyltransferase [Nitrososphaera sp.]
MMKTFAIIPVKKFENSKTRLSPVLSADERVSLSSLMLDDTLSVLAGAQSLQQLVVVSGDRRAEEIAARHGAKFLHEEKESGVNSAVSMADSYCADQGADATVVIPQDLPLLDAVDVAMACGLAENETRCIVICPSLRYDGTNLLLRKPSSLTETYYDNDSYEAHIKAAGRLGVPVKLFFSKKLMSDVDTAEDARQLAKEAGSNKTLEFLKSRFGKF